MSTRSRIAVMQPDGEIGSIYCHFDGYCNHVGRMLKNHHNTEEKVNQLVSLGNISSLHEYLIPITDEALAYFRSEGVHAKVPEKEHSFDTPQQGVTVAYYRDRHENFVQNVYKTLDDYNINAHFESYNYLWKLGRWYIRRKSNWVELTEEMIIDGIEEE